MVTKVRDVKIDLVLEPVYWEDLPEIRIEFNQQILISTPLVSLEKFSWLLPAKDLNRLSVFFLNKHDRDTVNGQDKAVVIKEIALEGLRYSSFMYASQYCPIYSEGYYRYAKKHNIQIEPIIHSNYLGFNGEWFLEFTWPTFTWIYELETSNLGWIYEKNI
jgi:hypothetical protein